MKIAVLALMLLGLTAASADATSFAYLVEGAATITGNDACGGPCVQRLDFSFGFEYRRHVDFPESYVGFVLPGSVRSTGPLGDFALVTGPVALSEYYVQFFTPGNVDEIDLHAGRPPGSTLPTLWTTAPWIGPEFVYSFLWQCRSDACSTAFRGQADLPFQPHPLDVRVTRVAMSEHSSSLLLLGIGLAVLVVAGRWSSVEVGTDCRKRATAQRR
jgi:hypothetical protein